MNPKQFLTEMLSLIHDLATATHAGEQALVAQKADLLQAQLDAAFSEDDDDPDSPSPAAIEEPAATVEPVAATEPEAPAASEPEVAAAE